MGKVEQVTKQILRYLLQDFQSRELGADALEREYQGPSVSELKRQCMADDNTTTSVDFEVALKGLEQKKLVRTGPMEPYQNPPNSAVQVIGFFSKRQYVYLTAKGYNAAR